MWVPDLFVKNEKSGNFHDLTVPNRLMEIEPNGRILYSQRYESIINYVQSTDGFIIIC